MKTIRRILCCLTVMLAANVSLAADNGFTLEKYRGFEAAASSELDLMLQAMYQTAVYAQAAIEHPAICFTPIPIAGAELRAMIAEELATPNSTLDRPYSGDDPVALILVNALKAQKVCR